MEREAIKRFERDKGRVWKRREIWSIVCEIYETKKGKVKINIIYCGCNIFKENIAWKEFKDFKID